MFFGGTSDFLILTPRAAYWRYSLNYYRPAALNNHLVVWPSGQYEYCSTFI